MCLRTTMVPAVLRAGASAPSGGQLFHMQGLGNIPQTQHTPPRSSWSIFSSSSSSSSLPPPPLVPALLEGPCPSFALVSPSSSLLTGLVSFKIAFFALLFPEGLAGPLPLPEGEGPATGVVASGCTYPPSEPESESVISASLPMVNNYLVSGRLRGHKMDECMLKSHGLNRGSSTQLIIPGANDLFEQRHEVETSADILDSRFHNFLQS
ncbi:hypothetical protein KC19_2G133400 [Ceratodon purpureus]|uniref:Uncharacterized protein n=1 Tax=Ceratodon purpureus TaxID=3225 RepID=A0A8T0IX99_CERPU|nr:hypothetical protein KC19_2G133400 [Ceratodon purpureus]